MRKGVNQVNPKSPWLGRTEGPWLNTFQPKIFRLNLEKNKTIYRNIST